jgi:hypothetical protein
MAFLWDGDGDGEAWRPTALSLGNLPDLLRPQPSHFQDGRTKAPVLTHMREAIPRTVFSSSSDVGCGVANQGDQAGNGRAEGMHGKWVQTVCFPT